MIRIYNITYHAYEIIRISGFLQEHVGFYINKPEYVNIAFHSCAREVSYEKQNDFPDAVSIVSVNKIFFG